MFFIIKGLVNFWSSLSSPFSSGLGEAKLWMYPHDKTNPEFGSCSEEDLMVVKLISSFHSFYSLHRSKRFQESMCINSMPHCILLTLVCFCQDYTSTVDWTQSGLSSKRKAASNNATIKWAETIIIIFIVKKIILCLSHLSVKAYVLVCLSSARLLQW